MIVNVEQVVIFVLEKTAISTKEREREGGWKERREEKKDDKQKLIGLTHH